MRIILCGGRKFQDRALLFEQMDRFHEEHEVTELAHGDARGADRLGRDWAKSRNIRTFPYPANWDEHGDWAGPIRNQEMLDDFEPDAVVAFEGGSGTIDMCRRARRYKIPVYWLPQI